MKNLDAYKLKWIAIIGMILNHVVIAGWDIIPLWLRFPLYAAGGLTFPIMGYFVVEGYKHTSNLNRYILRLLVFGLLAMPFHILAIGVPLGGGNPALYPWLNIMFSIVLSLLVLVMYDKLKIRAIFWFIFILFLVPISLLFFEWYFIGITVVLLFHIIRNETARRIVPPIVAGVLWLGLSLLSGAMPEVEGAYGLITDANFYTVMPVFGIGCVAAAVLLKNYNEERGKQMKWLFYILYPLHLALLAGVALVFGWIDLSVFGF